MVIITTYNRPSILRDLLDDIEREKYTGDVLVVNDGSTVEYDLTGYSFDINYLTWENNKGKTKYYQVISSAYKYTKKFKFNYL